MAEVAITREGSAGGGGGAHAEQVGPSWLGQIAEAVSKEFELEAG